MKTENVVSIQPKRVTKQEYVSKKKINQTKNTLSNEDNDSNYSEDSDDDSDASEYNKQRLNVLFKENLASKLAGLQCNSYNNIQALEQHSPHNVFGKTNDLEKHCREEQEVNAIADDFVNKKPTASKGTN